MQSVGAAGGSPIHTARRHFRSCWDGVHGDIHTQLAQDLEHVRLLLAMSIGQVRDVLDGDDGLQLAQDGCGEDELGLVLVMCPVHFVLARCSIADPRMAPRTAGRHARRTSRDAVPVAGGKCGSTAASPHSVRVSKPSLTG